MTDTSRPLIRYPGSKWGMAQAILQHFPEHRTYIEPFFGGGSIFFSKEPSEYEVINDLASVVVEFWRMVRDRPDELAFALETTPWSREEYELSYEVADNPLERARRFAVRCNQAFGVRLSTRTGWRNRHSVEHSPVTEQWLALPSRLRDFAERLRYNVEVENRPAVDVIRRYQDQYDTLWYLDPPYVLGTRSGTYYLEEMDDEGHYNLLRAILNIRGAVILSGYRHPLYAIMLRGWHMVEVAEVAELGQKRTEILWMNDRARFAKQMELWI